jgi:hypothetical protein
VSSALELDPEPRSVRDARAWIVDELTTIGREDLVDAARLGVSELVTNAILHADPPILVRLGGTPMHPRVEVHDSSATPPTVRHMTDDARLLATVGRGLSIVAMYSTTWGSEVSADGKVVWFEPATETAVPHLSPNHLTGDVFDLEELVDELVAAAGEPERRVSVWLLGLPVQVFAHYRSWFEELRRELRLLALSHGADYPVAQELSEVALRAEQETRQARGTEELEAAIRNGAERADLQCELPASAPATMARLRELLEEVDDFCREQRLLTLAPSRQQQALRSWYLGEFERQGRGEKPVPWPDGYVVDLDR